jgi:hypothetical protein
MTLNSKDAAIFVQPWTSTEFPRFWDSPISRQLAHEGGKVASPTHGPTLPHRKYSCYSFLLEAVAGRIMSMKNSNDNIENRIRDLPICSAVPEPTALSRAPDLNSKVSKVSGCTLRVGKVRFSLQTRIVMIGTTSMYKCKGKKCNTLSVYGTLSVTRGSISSYAVAWEIRV